jgi:hypothetical protein
MNWLENLRGKPKSVRRHIANMTALVIGGIIFVIWAVTLPSRLADVGDKKKEGGLAPFTVLKNAVTETFEATKTSINQFDYGNE